MSCETEWKPSFTRLDLIERSRFLLAFGKNSKINPKLVKNNSSPGNVCTRMHECWSGCITATPRSQIIYRTLAQRHPPRHPCLNQRHVFMTQTHNLSIFLHLRKLRTPNISATVLAGIMCICAYGYVCPPTSGWVAYSATNSPLSCYDLDCSFSGYMCGSVHRVHWPWQGLYTLNLSSLDPKLDKSYFLKWNVFSYPVFVPLALDNATL